MHLLRAGWSAVGCVSSDSETRKARPASGVPFRCSAVPGYFSESANFCHALAGMRSTAPPWSLVSRTMTMRAASVTSTQFPWPPV